MSQPLSKVEESKVISEASSHETQTNNAVDFVEDAVFCADSLGKLVYLNPAGEELFGYSSHELVGHDAGQLLPQRYGFIQDYLGVESNGLTGQPVVARTFNLHGLRKDESEFAIELSLTSIKTHTGRFTTGRIKSSTGAPAEIAPGVNGQIYKLVLEATPEAIAVIDRNAKIILTNRQTANIYGFDTAEAMIGCDLVDLSQNAAQTTQALNQALDSREPIKLSSGARRKNGSKFSVELSLASVADGDGSSTVLVAIVKEADAGAQGVERELRGQLESVRRALSGTIDALASTIQIQDQYIADHQLRVARLACAIAREMGFSMEEVEAMRVAGTVHDIGKLYVPAHVLSKPGKLTETEFEVVKKHVVKGYEIISTIEFPGPVADALLHHHERLDGTGYPHGIKGDDIDRDARILAIADVVEAMSSRRPYRSGLGIDKALEEIMQNAGIKYDGEAAEACIKLFSEKRFSFVPGEHAR